MKNNHYHWAIALTGAALFSAAGANAQEIYMDSTNRVTLSARFGLNIHAKFKNIGNDFAPGSLPGIYDDGYVLTDSTGNQLGFTTYWGYDNSAQYTPQPPGNDTITFNQTRVTGGVPSEVSDDNGNPYPGLELTYDRQLGEKEDWHHLRYGLEGAVNYMKISLKNNVNFVAATGTSTTVYQVAGAPTPPPLPAPYQGPFSDTSGSAHDLVYQPFSGPTPSSSGPENFSSQDQFDGDLWGGRLGPYLEFPLAKNFDLRLSGGLAVGLLHGNESWQETLALPGGGSVTTSGGGDALDTLWGGYASLDATWQISRRWAVDAAVQFQDLGKFDRNFPGSQVKVEDSANSVVNVFNQSFPGHDVELDLSRSLFVEVGISYSF